MRKVIKPGFEFDNTASELAVFHNSKWQHKNKLLRREHDAMPVADFDAEADRRQEAQELTELAMMGYARRGQLERL